MYVTEAYGSFIFWEMKPSLNKLYLDIYEAEQSIMYLEHYALSVFAI